MSVSCLRLLTSCCLCPCAFSELACSHQIWRLKPSWKSRSLSWKSPVWNVSIWSFRSSSTRSGSAPARYCSTPAWPQGGFLRGGHTAPETNPGCFWWKAQGESRGRAVDCMFAGSCDPLGPPAVPFAGSAVVCWGVVKVLWSEDERRGTTSGHRWSKRDKPQVPTEGSRSNVLRICLRQVKI